VDALSYIIGGVEMVRDMGKYQGSKFGCNFGRAARPKIRAYRTPAHKADAYKMYTHEMPTYKMDAHGIDVCMIYYTPMDTRL
jgi:hypothetical protein